MAARNRPTKASYETHELVKVDTSDNEDHTFCGIMFPIRAKAILPVDRVVIHSLGIRGQLGPITVWVTNEDETPDALGEYSIRLTSRHWTKIYEQSHPPSQRVYQKLDLKPNVTINPSTGNPMLSDSEDSLQSNNSVVLQKPLILRPGQIRGIYIHSTLPGDEAIVYDNSDPRCNETVPRYEDSMIAVYSGKAHLSPTPFGQLPIWGWGNAWRDRREFVGQIQYGATYRLWSPDLHDQFGTQFRRVAQTFLAMQRRSESPFSLLPDECLFYILNMCRWDWFADTAPELKREQRARKRRIRRRRIAEQRRLDHQQAQAAAARRETQQQPQPQQQQPQQQQGAVVVRSCQQQQHGSGNNNNNESSDDGAAAAVAAANLNDDGSSSDAGGGDSNNNQAAAAAGASASGGGGGDNNDDDGNESDESAWERANGYRADATAFSYRYMSSDDEAEAAQHENPPFFRSLLARAWVIRRIGQGQQRTGGGNNNNRMDDDDSGSDF